MATKMALPTISWRRFTSIWVIRLLRRTSCRMLGRSSKSGMSARSLSYRIGAMPRKTNLNKPNQTQEAGERMTPISRRDVLAGLAASSAVSIVPVRGEEPQVPAASSETLLSGEEQRKHADALLRYFAANAPQLLRPPDGILKHPSVAPSLPGKRYSTNLWDWDTLWTSQGLFRLAALQNDESLKQEVCKHVSGSLLNFLEHASPDGKISIMMPADDPDPFGVLGAHTTSKNQAKPVFGQLGLLACDQRGDASWLEPHFDSILRFYDSWIGHNSSSI